MIRQYLPKTYLFTLYNTVYTEYAYQNTCIYMVCQYVCNSKVLVILTKVVISLVFSKISPEANAKTANYTKFDIKQMENGKFCG